MRDSAEIIACLGVVVDAKDEGAERFYEKYGFVTVDASWPRRMFVPLQVARDAFAAGSTE